MSTATPFPWSELSVTENAETGFRSIFERAPIAAARCNPERVIIEMNPAFEQALDPDLANQQILRLCDLVPAEDRDTTESLLRALLDSTCDSIRVKGTERRSATDGLAVTNWTAWRLPASGEEPPQVLLIAERDQEIAPVKESLLQTQRWEAIGRLAGGVVHDFNNLLTGVMLYCDLLLSSLDTHDRRRRYAVEIRSTTLQATGLVRQLLVFARPQATQVRSLCLNQIAEDMQDLLTRLIGENVKLELRLEPDLGLVKIDPAQAQQVILNLILNACDALTHSGHIVVETSNCKFQTVTGSMPARRGAATAPSPAFCLSSPTTVAAWTRNTSAPLRAFFHHQECWPRYRPGTYHSPRHCYHKPGIDSHRKRTWPWDAGHDPAATSIPRQSFRKWPIPIQFPHQRHFKKSKRNHLYDVSSC